MTSLRHPTCLLLASICVCAISPGTLAEVNLEWRCTATDIHVGDTVDVGLYAVSDTSGNQLMAGMDVIFVWDPAYLQFVGVVNNGPYSWMFSGLAADDPFGLNESIPPQDGDGLYLAQGRWGNLPAATPAGLLATTFRFTALERTCGTELRIPATGGEPETETVVWSGSLPGTPITGTLGVIALAIDSPPCDAFGDMNCDGLRNGLDIAPFVLAVIDPVAYESAYDCEIVRGDMNGDGWVDAGDVLDFMCVIMEGCSFPLGDMNCDNHVDGRDIAPFVTAVLDPEAVAEELAGCGLAQADINCDGLVDLADVQPFVTVLLGGCGTVKGDLNCDRIVAGRDIQGVTRVLMGFDGDADHFRASDLNNDGAVNEADLQAFIAMLLQ